MRKIKFKAYVKESGEIYDVKAIFFDAEFVRLDKKYGETDFMFDEIELMQYVGEKDYQGREIYESYVYSDEMGYLWQVVFNYGKFCLLEIPNPFNHNNINPLDNIWLADMEFEGNIYDNPELLKVKIGCNKCCLDCKDKCLEVCSIVKGREYARFNDTDK